MIVIGVRRCVAWNGSDVTRRPASEITTAIGYLEGEAAPRLLLVALRRIADTRGLAKLVKSAGIEREILLSGPLPSGHPCRRRQSEGLKLTPDRTIRP